MIITLADKKRNTLVCLAITDKVIEGSPLSWTADRK